MTVDPMSYPRFGGPPRALAANADRERAVDVLKAGFAEGRLTKAEHDDRVGRVYAARTYGELGSLVADLPAGPLGGQARYPDAGTRATGDADPASTAWPWRRSPSVSPSSSPWARPRSPRSHSATWHGNRYAGPESGATAWR